MKLGGKSKALLKTGRDEAHSVCVQVDTYLKKGRAEYADCVEAGHRLRVAASNIEEVAGRIFYAKERKR